MSETVARILGEVEQLSWAEREELADLLAENLANIPPAIQKVQVEEVRRRISEVAAGKVSLVAGDEAMRHVRQLVESARTRTR